MRLFWVQWATVVAVGLHSGLVLEVLVISSLLLLPLDAFQLFCLHGVDLEPGDLRVVVEFLLLVPRLLPVLFFYLALEETTQHISFLVDPDHSFLLLLAHPLLEGLNLLLLELVPLHFPLLVDDCRFVVVDAVELFLVLNELVVVLFVD